MWIAGTLFMITVVTNVYANYKYLFPFPHIFCHLLQIKNLMYSTQSNRGPSLLASSQCSPRVKDTSVQGIDSMAPWSKIKCNHG